MIAVFYIFFFANCKSYNAYWNLPKGIPRIPGPPLIPGPPRFIIRRLPRGRLRC